MKRNRGKVAWEVPDLLKERVEELRAIFPEAVCEGRVDFEKLRAALGEEVEAGRERYSFSWAGKRDAIRLLQTPSRATLLPAPSESVDFETTGNLFIEGDNLEVLKLLYKPYFGAVKMIYIDPPYNTGNDFIYPDNFADPLDTYLKLTGQKDSEGNLLTSNPETSGRYHSAWLSMMYPRLFLARQLLSEDGVIFISIDDNELADLCMLMNEVFGEENRVAIVSWEKRFTRSNNARLFASVKDSIVVYRKTQVVTYLREGRTEKSDSIYDNPDNDPRGSWTSVSYVNPATKEKRPNLVYLITNPFTKEEVTHPTNAWKFEKCIHETHVKENRLWWGKDGGYKYPRLKKFLSDVSDGMVPVDLWAHKESGTTDEGSKELASLIEANLFDNPKPSRLIQRMLKIGTFADSEDLVLDFFSGSGTTAQAVLDLNRKDGGNRRFILVQLPEPTSRTDYPTIADIGKERIRRVIAKLKKEDEAKLPKDHSEDLGFRVFKLAPSHHDPWAGAEEKKPESYAAVLAEFQDSLLPGWTDENLLWEIALKEGFGLNSKIEKLFTAEATENTQKGKGKDRTAKGAMNTKEAKAEKGTTPTLRHPEGTRESMPSKDRVAKEGASMTPFYRVTDPDKGQHFIACFTDTLDTDALKPLHLSKDDLFICRDTALSDEIAANLALQCRLKTI